MFAVGDTVVHSEFGICRIQSIGVFWEQSVSLHSKFAKTHSDLRSPTLFVSFSLNNSSLLFFSSGMIPDALKNNQRKPSELLVKQIGRII